MFPNFWLVEYYMYSIEQDGINVLFWGTQAMVLTWVCPSVLLDLRWFTFCLTKAGRSLMAFTASWGHTGFFHERHDVGWTGHSYTLCHWTLCGSFLACLRASHLQLSWGDWHFRVAAIFIFKARRDEIMRQWGTSDFVYRLRLNKAASRLFAAASFLSITYGGISRLRAALEGQRVYIWRNYAYKLRIFCRVGRRYKSRHTRRGGNGVFLEVFEAKARVISRSAVQQLLIEWDGQSLTGGERPARTIHIWSTWERMTEFRILMDT